MSVRNVAALVVAALVAGVILGSLTIAGAGGGPEAYYGAEDCSGGSCAVESAADCGDCAPQAAVPAPPVAPAGGGGCPDCAVPQQ
jgi:hypothetical protein